MFDDPDDVVLIEFSVAGPVPVTLFTSNFDPNNLLAYLLDPILALFSGTGDFAGPGA